MGEGEEKGRKREVVGGGEGKKEGVGVKREIER